MRQQSVEPPQSIRRTPLFCLMCETDSSGMSPSWVALGRYGRGSSVGRSVLPKGEVSLHNRGQVLAGGVAHDLLQILRIRFRIWATYSMNKPPNGHVDEFEYPSDVAFAVRTPAEEFVNTLTHAAGLALSVAGGCFLIAGALSAGDAWRITGSAVFVATLTAVYAFSTLSHCTRRPGPRRLYRRLDQGFIYLLIAGTYTPFALIFLRSGWWWLLTGTMWGVALVGCIGKIFFPDHCQRFAIWTYLLLGWLPAMAAGFLIHLVPGHSLSWVLIGGLCYTVGTIFLFFDRHSVHFHPIWHLWVIAGSACHYYAIYIVVA